MYWQACDLKPAPGLPARVFVDATRLARSATRPATRQTIATQLTSPQSI